MIADAALALALAYGRLGQEKEARAWLAQADEWIARTTQGLPADATHIPGVDYRVALVFPLLRREAAALLPKE